MQSFKQQLSARQLAIAANQLATDAARTTVSNKYKTAVNNNCQLLDNKTIDEIINEFRKLTKTGKNMDAWHAKCIRIIGIDKWIALAKIAKADGKNPARYFSWLIKKELDV